MSEILAGVRTTLLKNVQVSDKGLIITFRVKKSSEEGDFLTIEGDELVFNTTEDIETGRANAALIRFLSTVLKIPVSKSEIIYGQRGNLKRVLVKDHDMEEVVEKLYKNIRLI